MMVNASYFYSSHPWNGTTRMPRSRGSLRTSVWLGPLLPVLLLAVSEWMRPPTAAAFVAVTPPIGVRIPRVILLYSSPSSSPDEEGAQLAAAFFKTAQAKGIRIDDLLDDDDDYELSPEDDVVILEKEEDLLANVTLTNDQLYSEVKERVLESAGGFVALVAGATDDEDDTDDGEAEEAEKPYVVPTVVPDSELTAGEVVLLVLEALRHNDMPTPNKGVEILFGYASPGSQIRQEIGLTPVEYADFLKETEYKILFTHVTRRPIPIDKADYSTDGKKAFFTARLQASSDQPLDTVSVNFILSTTGRADEDSSWLIDSILIRPQSMRRRRRK